MIQTSIQTGIKTGICTMDYLCRVGKAKYDNNEIAERVMDTEC